MTATLIITTFNRPNYLQQCFDSLRRSDLSQIEKVLVIDDHSTDQETIRLINEFEIPGVEIVKIRKGKNKGIKDSLAIGYLIAFEHSNIVINLDGDAIVKGSWVNTLLYLKEQFPNNIVCGFNTTVKNRNPIIEEHPIYFKKKYASGINMVLNKDQYEDYVLPAISKPIGNWDFDSSKLHEADGKAVIVSKPSVIQHIGISESSMGHISASEPPDYAEDFVMDFQEVWTSPDFPEEIMPDMVWAKLQLPSVTLIGADGFDVNRLIHAADISCRDIQFGSVKILSHLRSNDPRVIKIRPLLSSKDYSQFILKEIVNYVDTDYLLIFQHDGFVINADSWSDEFLNYDHVGAAWKFRPEKRTANGGFSLRSRRMCEAIRDDNGIYLQNDNIITNWAEDHVLFYIYREYLEWAHNVKIAPEEICDKFSIEAWGEKPPNNRYKGSFGFHGFNTVFEETDLPYIPYKLPNRKIL